jgi:ABC-2 type transport system permease protein
MSWTAFTALVRRDLRLFFQDKRALTMSFVAPIVIGSFFGYLFGSAGNRPASKIEVAIVDQDGTAVTRKLIDAMEKDPSLEVTARPLDQAESRVRGGKTTVAAVLPKGFAEAAGKAFFRGDGKPEIQLLYDPSHGAEMAMVRGIFTQHVMEVVSSEAFTGDTSQKLLDDALRDAQSSRGLAPCEGS